MSLIQRRLGVVAAFSVATLCIVLVWLHARHADGPADEREGCSESAVLAVVDGRIARRRMNDVGARRTLGRTDGDARMLREGMRAADAEGEYAAACAQIRDRDEDAFLAAVGEMSRDADPMVRMEAMNVLGAAYSRPHAPREADEGDERALSAEATRTRGIVSSVCACLHDEDSGVQAAAIKTARLIDGDARGVLASQTMFGNDAELKMAFIAATAGSATEADMVVSLMGMSAVEEDVRNASAENLKGLTGVEFSNADEAQSWWEKNHIEFLSKASGALDDENVAEALGPSVEDDDDVVDCDESQDEGDAVEDFAEAQTLQEYNKTQVN